MTRPINGSHYLMQQLGKTRPDARPLSQPAGDVEDRRMPGVNSLWSPGMSGAYVLLRELRKTRVPSASLKDLGMAVNAAPVPGAVNGNLALVNWLNGGKR